MGNEMRARLSELRDVKARIALGGGHGGAMKQHEQGKLTARERVAILVDPGSFVELNMLTQHHKGWPDDGIVAGYANIEGRPICLYSEDFTVLGGSQGDKHGKKMYETIERALRCGVPFVGLHDGAGARIMRPDSGDVWEATQADDEKGIYSTFFINTQASGVVPQVSAILGPCAGGSAYSPMLNDFIFMVDGISQMFITGPPVVKSVLGQEISKEELGGAKVHARVSGVCDFRASDERQCFERIRTLLSFLPSNCTESPPVVNTGDDPGRRDDSLLDIVPDDPRKTYDMHKVIKALADNGYFLEVKQEFAPEIIVGFARLGGHSVGFIANQPMVKAGSMTRDSSVKEARFIRFCDCFNIPLVSLVDTTGYMPGTDQEYGGIIRHGAKVLYAIAESVVPRIAVVVRKAYGGANQGMGVTSGMGADFVFLWPMAEIASIGIQQSVDLFYSKELAAAPDPVQFMQEKAKWYRGQYANALLIASKSLQFDDVIDPRDTRARLISSFSMLRNKKVIRYTKKHGNIPL